jgi:hypothetical protein
LRREGPGDRAILRPFRQRLGRLGVSKSGRAALIALAVFAKTAHFPLDGVRPEGVRTDGTTELRSVSREAFHSLVQEQLPAGRE